MNQALKSCYAFGDFRLDGAERQLIRGGAVVPLAPKVFDTLQLLVENSGHLVEKDEFMRRLWPDTFVSEEALTRNISILRKTLGESSDSQTFIATVPTRGYRFVAAVQKLSQWEGVPPQSNPTAKPISGNQIAKGGEPLPRRRREISAQANVADVPMTVSASEAGGIGWRSLWKRRIMFAAAGLIVGSVAGVVTFLLLSPVPVPRVIGSKQITFSGRVDPWPRLVTDGTSVYFLERYGDHWNLMRTSVSGGESQVLPTPARNAAVLDVSPDHTNLLIGSFDARETRMPLWIWPVSGGAFRRVGDITAYEALWHPNGHQIVYSEDDGVYICDADGTNARKFIATGEQFMKNGSWSPDGILLRFATVPESWEADANGKVLRRLQHSPDNIQNDLRGAWSPDGRYFFVDHLVARFRRDIWAVREANTPFRPRARPEVRLTNGPMSYEGMAVGKDGQKVFAVGVSNRNEVMRYDPKLRQPTPLVPGVCYSNLAFSPDGQWIACASADLTILRIKPDGSDRLVLAGASLSADNLRWSPDAKQIAFTGAIVGEHSDSAIFVAPLAGGAPRQVFPEDVYQADPSWSPDGNLLAFARAKPDPSSFSIWVLNLKTNQFSRVPGSDGMRCPAWSPDGHFIATASEDWHKLLLYDFRAQHWTQLAAPTVLNGNGITWSKDSKFLYFQDFLGKDEALYRVRLDNRKIEVVASFETLLRNGAQRVAFNGIAPDGSFTLSVERGGSDIYALTLSLP